MKKVCIVILNFNNYQDTIECIESVQEVDYCDYEIVVVDNHSSNESVKVLNKRFGNTITMIESDKNLGYAGGNNIGLRYAMGHDFEYVCVLNNDTVVQKDYLKKCVAFLEKHSDVAFVSPIVLEYANDYVQSSGGIIISQKGGIALLNTGKIVSELADEIECDFISGACLVFKMKFLREHGLIPENYFLFYEETEWCYKAKKRGMRNVSLKDTYIRHKGSVAINQVSGLSAYLMARNRVVFYKRNIASGVKYYLFMLYLMAETFYRALKYDKQYWKCYRYYFDGFRGRIDKKYPFVIINE